MWSAQSKSCFSFELCVHVSMCMCSHMLLHMVYILLCVHMCSRVAYVYGVCLHVCRYSCVVDVFMYVYLCVSK